MRIEPKTKHAIQRFAALLADRYSVAGVILYGSRARGTHRPDSDVDVAVLINGERLEFVETKMAMADLAFDVLLEDGLRISPLPIWVSEWERPEQYSNPELLRNIDREGIRF